MLMEFELKHFEDGLAVVSLRELVLVRDSVRLVGAYMFEQSRNAMAEQHFGRIYGGRVSYVQ